MPSSTAQLGSASSQDIVLKLPHPYLNEYILDRTSATGERRRLPHHDPQVERASLAVRQHPVGEGAPVPGCVFFWDAKDAPSLGQIWLLVYVIFTIQPGVECLRLGLRGEGSANVAQQMKDVTLAIELPVRPQAPTTPGQAEVLLLRSAFWQGAGSPFGPRPVWMPADPTTATSRGTPSAPQSPRRRVVYSRWIPHLRENFSMVALDPEDETHVNFFHTWQNDPRVSQGWNETGTLEQHKKYINDMHADPHQLAVLARFDDTCFAYFEIYWAKEDKLGAYYDAGDYDRGRHSLVGDIRYRGPHRVSAWWSSLMHYLFLDEPRTTCVVGEPKETNSTVVMYDLMHGFGVDKFVDLPHKRSAFVRCPRERFFQLSPLGDNEKVVGGMKIGLVPKL
ncbi:unnamed protein product [Parascedosporium putredinis]|uniref:Acyltransferase MbtK/IucB-like conserved domain-containing protein n=1 Tax=Parascedosporium putredinis TaxID=1442378 RepID=A0A9P1GWI4_9PEZI|nr:unnamed protein product [Parascedosporium putredinis]CAI7988884.1 unnamed protein product [Parascedosporium putredinis]